MLMYDKATQRHRGKPTFNNRFMTILLEQHNINEVSEENNFNPLQLTDIINSFGRN